MFKRIKLLTLLQLSDRFKLKKIESKKALAARIGILLFTLIAITAICGLLIYALCDIVMIPKTHNLITFVIFFLQLLSIIACTNGLLKTLYLGKDNSILLSYPAKHVEVFFSKLLVFYIYELIKGVFLLFPLLIAFGIIYKILTVGYVITTLVFAVLLPLLPVLIGAFLTMPVLLINRLINRFPIVKAALSVSLLVLLFGVVIYIMKLIPVPLRIVALYNVFIMKVTEFISAVNKYSLFYSNIGKLLVGESVLINYLIVFGVLIVMFILVAALAMPLYFSLASKSNEQANEKKRRGGNVAHKNTFFTFVKKEWLLSIRNLSEFINNYSFMFATPYVLYIMVSIFTAIDRNELGHSMTIAFSGFIVLILASASNTSSALAITQEGSEFVLLKTAPADTSNMAWAKIFFNLIFSTVMIVISFIILILFCDRIKNPNVYWLMMLAVIFINAGLILWSFQIDIMNPHLREYASNNDSSTVNNAAESIKIGLIITVFFTVLAVLFLMDGDNFLWQWFRIIGIAFVFLAARFYMFRSYLKNVFPDIEY
jgi:hypothetical protein